MKIADIPIHIAAGGSYFLMVISGVEEQITWVLGAIGMLFAIGYYGISSWVQWKNRNKE